MIDALIRWSLDNKSIVLALAAILLAWGAWQAVREALGTVGPEVAADLVELLQAIAYDPAGLKDVVQLGGQFQHGKLAPCYLLVRDHVLLLIHSDVLANSS